ncbi:unnamed protein product [Mytilus edulis]|uniref:Uncharacterized protein n=1 Tax=Mytilus edulis TaxID=6550 RepID=A0A8S3QVD2_MYTED|nr:unnamed protein product [Mytilus edulis]
MPFPDNIHSQKTFNSSEQVVPYTALEGMMEADLPNEKGAAEHSYDNNSMECSDVKIEVSSQHQPTYNSCDLIEDDKDVLQLETETQQDLSDSLHPKEFSSNMDQDKNNKVCSDVFSLDPDEDSNQHDPKQHQYPSGSGTQPWCPTFSVPLDTGDTDMGYSSHSACSSCQQGSQTDSGQNINFTDVEYAEDCFDGDDEMEDLLFHFDRFFRNRYEELLTEQGMHVRQIIKKAAKSYDDKCCIADTDPSSVEVTDKATQTVVVEKFSLPPIIIEDSSCQALERLEDHNKIPTKSLPLDQPGTACLSKDKQFLKILSLTCAVSNLLHRKEYKM